MNAVVELSSGDASARLVPGAGGRVSALRLRRPEGGVLDVLHPYPEDYLDPVRWAKGGMYPLMPYSNRIAHAVVQVNGEAVALQAHPDAAPHTLHGNAHLQAWQVAALAPDRATLTLDSPAGPAWPWHYTASLRFELTPSQLLVELALCNADQRLMPAGIGLHPYFRHTPDALLGFGATTLWPTTPEFLPGAARPLRSDERYLPARCLPDGPLTDYVGGWDGSATLELPQGARLTLQADPVFGHLVVHRPDTPVYLCLEPVSHVADGFNLAAHGVAHTGTQLLEPGACLRGVIRLALASQHERNSA